MLTGGLDPIFDAAQFSLTEVFRALVRKGYNLPSSSFGCYSALLLGVLCLESDFLSTRLFR